MQLVCYYKIVECASLAITLDSSNLTNRLFCTVISVRTWHTRARHPTTGELSLLINYVKVKKSEMQSQDYSVWFEINSTYEVKEGYTMLRMVKKLRLNFIHSFTKKLCIKSI